MVKKSKGCQCCQSMAFSSVIPTTTALMVTAVVVVVFTCRGTGQYRCLRHTARVTDGRHDGGGGRVAMGVAVAAGVVQWWNNGGTMVEQWWNIVEQ